jgi:hypothetical protein
MGDRWTLFVAEAASDRFEQDRRCTCRIDGFMHLNVRGRTHKDADALNLATAAAQLIPSVQDEAF